MSTNYEMRPGQGSAFKNDKKTEDWHPAYKGKVMLPDGSLHWLDITPKKTKKWISIQIGEPVAGGGGGVPPLDSHNQAKGNGYQPQKEDDSDIPF